MSAVQLCQCIVSEMLQTPSKGPVFLATSKTKKKWKNKRKVAGPFKAQKGKAHTKLHFYAKITTAKDLAMQMGSNA